MKNVYYFLTLSPDLLEVDSIILSFRPGMLLLSLDMVYYETVPLSEKSDRDFESDTFSYVLKCSQFAIWHMLHMSTGLFGDVASLD